MVRRIVNIAVSLLSCISLLLLVPGAVQAMPFIAAVNYAVGSDPRFVAAGDFNGDGKPDLAVITDGSNNVSILLNRGNGTFNAAVDYFVGTGLFGIAVGDFNNDGKLDLAVTAQTDGNVSVLSGNCDGTFGTAVNYFIGGSPVFIAVGDFNHDGKPDIAVTNQYTDMVCILLNRGDGTFNAKVDYAVGSCPSGIVAGDFNVDGNLDLVVSNYNDDNISVLLGRGDGTFNAAANYSVGVCPQFLTAGDFNGDSKPDLAVSNYDGDFVSILLNRGDGTFSAAVNYTVGSNPAGIAAGDFNGDGKLDLAVDNLTDSVICILLGNGDGTFDVAAHCTVGMTPDIVITGDFNMDGAVDLATTNYGSSSVSVLLNTFPIPSLTGVSPNVGTRGKTLTSVIITGANLLRASAVSFGSGITVNSFTVDNATRITVNITIAGNAADGKRNVSVTTPGGTVTLNNGFTVKLAQIATTPHGSSVPGGTVSTPQGPVPLPTVSVRSASLSATSVAPGTPITVTADVVNTGTVNGAGSIKVYVNGELENSQGVTVNSGSSTPVTFIVSRNEPGTYSVYVGSTNAGSFTVDQFADPNTVLYISGALLLFAFIIGAILILQRRRL